MLGLLTTILDLLTSAWALFWVGVGLVGLVLFVRWMLDEAGSLLTKTERDREESQRRAEVDRQEILGEERERVANEALAQAREGEERDRKTRLSSCHHEWVPATQGSPNGGISWRCSRCEVIASHDERALDASLDGAWRNLEQINEGVKEAAERANEASREARDAAGKLRALHEESRFDREAFDMQQERKHLERVKESLELHGTPIPDAEASRIAHYGGLGEPILTNRESLISAIGRGLPETNGGKRDGVNPGLGGLVCVHAVGLGGGGKTFVSVNLAVALAGMTELDTAIVALLSLRDAERAQHRIPDELLDRPSVPTDGVTHGVEVAVEHLAKGLRIKSLPEFRRADKVAEECRDKATTGFTRRRQRAAAFVAELHSFGILGAA